jgi:hypothetical protein
MSVSYLSQKIESNPYVLPVDLNLLAKVNAYKQQAFYTNAEKIKSEYSTLKNSDILNADQKAVLDEKYGNLANQINSWGGVDYSDMAITNQMDKYASDIYSDPTILNGITSTKQIRTLQSNYEKMKTDPKLSKYYNSNNEAWDMQDAAKYISGGKNAKYNGTTAPTIYKGNPYVRLTENLKNLKPNVDVVMGPSGNPYYIDKTTKKEISADQVFADMDGRLDSDIMNQIKIDAWGNMKGVSNTDLINNYTKAYTTKAEGLNKLEETVKTELASATTDEARTIANRDLLEIRNRKKELSDNYKLDEFSKSLNTEEGNLAAKTRLYTNTLMDRGIAAYAIKDQQHAWSANLEKLQQDKMALAEYNAKIRLQVAAMKGKKAAQGEGSNITGLLNLSSNYQNADELKGETLSTEGILAQNIDVRKKQSNVLTSFFMNNADSPDFNTGNVKYLGSKTKDEFARHLADIAHLDGKEELTIDDVRTFLKGKTVSAEEKKFFQSAVDIFDRASKGDTKDIDNVIFSKGDFEATYKEYSDANNIISANQALMGRAAERTATVLQAKKGLSSAEANMVNEFIANKDKYVTYVPEKTSTTGSGQLVYSPGFYKINNNLPEATVKALRKSDIVSGNLFKKDTLDKELKGIYEDKEFRQNYYGAAIDFKSLGKNTSEAQALIKTLSGNSGDPSEIKPTQIQQNPTTSAEYKAGKPWTIEYSYKGGMRNTWQTDKVSLTDEQAKYLGVEINPRPELDRALKFKGSLEPAFVMNSNWGNDGVFKYQITQQEGGPLKVNVQTQEGSVVLKKFLYNDQMVPFSNAAQAIEIIERVIKNAHSTYKTKAEFLAALKENQTN